MSAKKLQVVEEPGDAPAPIAEMTGEFIYLYGEEFSIRDFRNFTPKEEVRWLGFLDMFNRLSEALEAYYDLGKLEEGDDPWEVEIPEPPDELVRECQYLDKRICRFAYPAVPVPTWKQLEADDEKSVGQLSKHFIQLVQEYTTAEDKQRRPPSTRKG